MASIIPGYQYDIFISYRQKDNQSDQWVTHFVNALKEELNATFKEPISVYFDANPQDGLQATHDVDDSLKEKVKCLVFIPIVSRTYCDPKSFAWGKEFLPFLEFAHQDDRGLKVTLPNGNVTSRVLPVRIHELDREDSDLFEKETGGVMRGIDFIYGTPGMNRPLLPGDKKDENLNKTMYRDQMSKLAMAIREIIQSFQNPDSGNLSEKAHSPGGTTATRSFDKGPRKKNKWLVATLMAVLLAVAGYFLYPHGSSGPTNAPITDKSIAVLPFDDFMSDGEMDYFADGLTEEILNVLAKTPDLKVASRTSSFQYKDKDDDARVIAGELGVAHILEGSVRGTGERLRVTAQLIRAADGFHLWSETYDRTKEDIIDIQENIALKIALALETVMDPAALENMVKAGTHSVEAYNFYLRGTSLFNSSDFIGSYENFEKARGIDPSFAEAHFMSALFWNSQLSLTSMNSGLTNKSYQEMMDLYNERLEQAIKYAEPVEKLKYLGHQAELKLQFRKGLDYMKDYLNKRPNDIHELATAISLAVVLGEKETAVNYVIQMDSAALTNADDIGEVIINYFWVGKYLEGARKAIQAVKDFPYDQHLLYQAHRVLLWNGMVKEAGELLPRLDGWESQALPKVRQACAENDSARAYAIYHAEIEPLKQLDNSVWISLMLFNRKEEATDYIRPLYDRDELYSLSSWLIYPYFDLTPFPKLQAVLDREGSKRPGATGIPFALKARP